MDDSEAPLFPVSNSTPSSMMKDSGFGLELLSPEPCSVPAISPGGDMVFDYNVEPPSRTQPIAISQRKKTLSTAQRHTNFTPPREYMSPVSMRRASLTNFCACGSLPRPLSLFLTDDDNAVSFTESKRAKDLSMESLKFSLSEPGFAKHREEQIAHELRTISDFYQMESGGYEHGYQFQEYPMPSRFHHRLYSSSFPGASDRNAGDWQYSIKRYPLQCMNQQSSDK